MIPEIFAEKNLMKAGSANARKARREKRTHSTGELTRLHLLKVIRLSNSKRKERARWLPTGSRPAPSQVSAKRLEIWGAGGPPPLSLSLYLAIIATEPAFESEGMALRNLSAGLRR